MKGFCFIQPFPWLKLHSLLMQHMWLYDWCRFNRAVYQIRAKRTSEHSTKQVKCLKERQLCLANSSIIFNMPYLYDVSIQLGWYDRGMVTPVHRKYMLYTDLRGQLCPRDESTRQAYCHSQQPRPTSVHLRVV